MGSPAGLFSSRAQEKLPPGAQTGGVNTLILGGTGFLSSALVAECLRAGHQVTIVTRGNAHRSAPPEGVETLVADRSNADALRQALGARTFDLVIDAILFRPDDARSAVDLLHGRTGRYVFISTDFVYGGEPRLFPIAENAPRSALSAYGRNKAACEDVFFAARADDGFPATMLRPPHILGVGGLLGTGSREGRDPWLLWRLRNHRPIVLIDNGALLIQPVHKDDIARACLAVVASDETVGRAYNMAGPDCVTTRRYYELIAEIIGTDLATLSLPSDAYLAALPDQGPYAQNRAYSLAALADDAGFVPTVRLFDALAQVIAALDAKGQPEGLPPSEQTPLMSLLRAQHNALVETLSGGR